MNITLTSLEALILKATHQSLPCPDAAALEAFCAVMKDSAEGPMFAAQALAARIHSSNAQEALLALTMLDRCMRRCDASFHAEVGKFRFLNEMIKLVSPKYFADRTAPEVRTRVLQLLHAWSMEYPKETKFKVAYDMLKNQGVVKETPPPLPPEGSPPPPRPKNAIFEDEEKSKLLQKLLQSKKPEDLQHANRLIKTMVREDERRHDNYQRCWQEVSMAIDSANLLDDMLKRASEASPDEEQLIDELHASCMRFKSVLQRLASTDTEVPPQYLTDIIQTSQVLNKVSEDYHAFVAKKKDKKIKPNKPEASNGSLLDFAGASGDADAAKGKPNVIDELGEIFSTSGGTSNIAEPLKPVNLMFNDTADLLEQVEKRNKTEGWNELDSLGEQLLKQSLPDNVKRIDGFNSKGKKIPMNALEKMSPNKETQSSNESALFDLDFFTKNSVETNATAKKSVETKATTPEASKPNLADDVMVDISTNDTPNAINNNTNINPNSPLDNILDLSLPLENNKCDVNNTKATLDSHENSAIEKQDNSKKASDVKPLTDINVSLQSVKPSKVPPMTIFEEASGITVVLHFCKDKPRPDVNVLVISTTSKCSSPIEDYKFQAVVPKGCKVRLLTPSGTSLPACNPFLPPPALTQVMLIARPTPSTTPCLLKFVITYTVDEETCSEMGEVKDLPLDEV